MHGLIMEKGDKRVALVTAGAAGIGRAIAEVFLADGLAVHVCDISQSAIDDFLRSNPTASATLADVADAGQVDEVFQDLEVHYGRLDVLVNNAGIAGPTGPAEEIDPADWDRTIAVDINGQFYCARKAIPMLKAAGAGVIINMASSAGLMGCPDRLPYAVSKWALIGLTKTLAMELGRHEIRVNAICPGSVSGPRIDRVIERDARKRGLSEQEIRDVYSRQTSMRRFVHREDVAAMARFLASDAAAMVSGQAIGVDGHTETLAHHWNED